jgi:hypothetical protein
MMIVMLEIDNNNDDSDDNDYRLQNDKYDDDD